ncbi:MAG: serine hydrolase domain-containing protein [Chloroflexota bacterium]
MNPTNYHSIDAYLEWALTHYKLPGMIATIVRSQETPWTKALGYANLEQERAMTPDSLMRISSVTKMFTATMLMQLQGGGQLQLDDPVEKHLPEFSVLRQDIPITFRHLVSHTSGLPIMPQFATERLPRPIDELTLEDLYQLQYPTVEEAVASLSETELLFRPGTQFNYSNFGIAVMTRALKNIVQQPYTDYLTTNILQPLGMNDATFNVEDILDERIVSGYYSWDGKTPQLTPYLGSWASTGGLHTSATEIANFMAFHLEQGQDSHTQILSQKTIEQMKIPIREMEKSRYKDDALGGGVGIGWFLSSIGNHKIVEHGGGDFPSATFLALVPEKQLGVFIGMNTGNEVQARTEIAYECLALLLRGG